MVSIIPLSGVAQSYTLPTPTVATDSTLAATQTAQVAAVNAIPLTAVKDAENSANQKESAAPVPQEAAASFNYPLGDKEFSFFKDASGKTITRYVSERDGTVTYAPQPTLVKSLSIEA